jgi:hypothetical protein
MSSYLDGGLREKLKKAWIDSVQTFIETPSESTQLKMRDAWGFVSPSMCSVNGGFRYRACDNCPLGQGNQYLFCVLGGHSDNASLHLKCIEYIAMFRAMSKP